MSVQTEARSREVLLRSRYYQYVVLNRYSCGISHKLTLHTCISNRTICLASVTSSLAYMYLLSSPLHMQIKPVLVIWNCGIYGTE